MSTMRQRRTNATPDEKGKARALAALGGVPYLHALYTLRTLDRLAGRIDLGDLAAVLDDRADRRPIGLRVDSTDLRHLDRLFTLGLNIADIGTVTSGATNETRLHLTVAIDDTTIHYEHILGGPLHPAGASHVDTEELIDQLTAEMEEHHPSLVAHAASRPTIVPIPADTDGVSLAAGALTRTNPLIAHWPAALHDLTDQLLDTVEPADRIVVYDLRGTRRWSGIDLPAHQTLWYRHPTTYASADD